MENMAQPQFALVDNTVTLNLPRGLSLAPMTAVRQESTQHIASIAGGEVASVSWIVRGDEMGEYDLSADFEGTLMPFRETVTARFETDESLIVNASRGLILYLYPSIGAISGQEYRVGFRLANESEVTFNMARLGFNEDERGGQDFEFDLVGDVRAI